MRRILLFFITALMTIGAMAQSVSFSITDNGDGTVTVTPTPADTKWVLTAYPEAKKDDFPGMFGLSENYTDADFFAFIQENIPVAKVENTGAATVEYAELTEYFGGGNSGVYHVIVAKVNADNNVTDFTSVQATFPEIVECNYVDQDDCTTDMDCIYQNETWYARFDVKTPSGSPFTEGKIYTLDDLDMSYSKILEKTAVGTQNWKKYTIKSLKLKFSANKGMDAMVVVVDGDSNEKTLNIYYEPNDFVNVSLSGEYEVVSEGLIAVTASNIAADYKVLLGIKKNDLTDGDMISTDDITAVGNSITSPYEKDGAKITDVNLMVMQTGENVYGLMGTIKTAAKTYDVKLKLTKPASQNVEVDFGNTLVLSEDEGDLKMVATKSEAYQIVVYPKGLTPAQVNALQIPSGKYDLLSYSRFKIWDAGLGFFVDKTMDEISNSDFEVVTEGGITSITWSFNIGNDSYLVKAATPNPASIESVTSNDDAKVVKVLTADGIQVFKNGKKYNVAGQEVK